MIIIARRNQKEVLTKSQHLHMHPLHLCILVVFVNIISTLDANGNEKISTFELREILLCLDMRRNLRPSRKLREMDCNGDTWHIDLEEFTDVINDTSNKLGVDENEEGHLRDVFFTFDIDRINGPISPKELQLAGSHQLALDVINGVSMKERRRMIKAVDKNGDDFNLWILKIFDPR
ncbi:uncharacterized protein LOC108980481 [Juglans regia]|uniref:Uncharacterized protein LOC108980481 n=1 Tax=Juglans regia TaxID=51240 RepID=A0A6P9DX25_JUGRE|nr:uncharacterized protein LOC108980481 [Juglans regia]